MSNLANYKVVLTSIGEKLANKEDAAWIIAQIFNIKKEEVVRIVDLTPIILFDNLSLEDVKSLQSAVVFLTAMGLTVSITTQKCAGLSTTNWKPRHTPATTTCPCCGEAFLLVHSKDVLNITKTNEKHPVENAISNEFEEIEGLSAELESIANEASDDSEIEEIEEIGSVSQEMEEIGSFSEELGDLTEELEELSNHNNFPQGNISEIEDIEGISAEFEEIEGVSAEFERICMDDMEDIGSLSAELEEIEGISAEFEKITEDNIERLDSEKVGNFALRGVTKSQEQEEDIEELEAISAELEKIADPVEENNTFGIDPDIENEESFTQLFLSGEKAQKTPEKAVAKKMVVPEKIQKSIVPKTPVAKVAKPKSSSLTIKPGPYNVVININKQGNIALANKTISKLLQVPINKVAEATLKQPALTVAKKVSKETAQAIITQFQKYKMSGHITIHK